MHGIYPYLSWLLLPRYYIYLTSIISITSIISTYFPARLPKYLDNKYRVVRKHKLSAIITFDSYFSNVTVLQLLLTDTKKGSQISTLHFMQKDMCTLALRV